MESQDKIPQEATNKMEDDVKELAKLLNMFIFIKSANNHDLVRVIEHFKGIVLYNQAINDWFQKTLNDKFGVMVSQDEVEKERPKHKESESEYSEDESDSEDYGEKVVVIETTSSESESDPDLFTIPVIPEEDEEKHEEEEEEKETKEVKSEETEQEIKPSVPRGGNRKTPFQSYRAELEKFQKGTYYRVWRHWASILDLIHKKIMNELKFGMFHFFTTRVYNRLVGTTTNFTEFKQNVTQASEKFQLIYKQLKVDHPHIKEELNELERELIRFEKCLLEINV